MTWDEVWLDIANTVSKRSRCVNSQVGAVIVSATNRIDSTGYNGPPAGMPVKGPCSGWCPRALEGDGRGTANYDNCLSLHAEINALLQADATAIKGGTIAVTRVPCINCAKVIANSGLVRVLCREASEDDDPHRAALVFAYLLECGVRIDFYHGEPS